MPVAFSAFATCVPLVGFESLTRLELSRSFVDNKEVSTSVAYATPSGEKPIVDYVGLPADEAGELNLLGVPLVGATAEKTIGVLLKRRMLEDGAKLHLKVS